MLADNHTYFREELRKLCEKMAGVKIVGEAGDGLELIEFLQRSKVPPDMVLLDISMPRLNGIKATRKAKMLHPDVKILILTVHNEREYLCQAFSAGAEGYLLKDDLNEGLVPAIEKIRSGGTFVSPGFLNEL
jgi:DNA-binding NarL/FixJ family response regulator